jgi:hypothetical protein
MTLIVDVMTDTTTVVMTDTSESDPSGKLVQPVCS